MSSFGTVQIGRLTLTELPTQAYAPASAAPNSTTPTGRTLQILGQESFPAYTPLTLAQLRARQEDLLGLTGEFVQVQFTDRADLNGYYTVTDASTSLVNWNGEAVTVDWTVDLMRVGTDTEVDIESRLTGGTRVNSFSATGVRWHAPAIDAYGYYTAPGNTPSAVTRTGTDGAMPVYLGLPNPCIPRWGCPVGSYLGGRVRFLDANNIERSGIQLQTTVTGWQLHNGLVRVTLSTGAGVLSIDAYTGGAWQTKAWDLQYNGASLGQPVTVSLLRNEPEIIVARLLWSLPTPQRITADLTLRRGSRFVELYIQAQISGTIKLVRATAEIGASGGGGEYVTAVNDDAAGNRYVVGSAKTNTQDLANGGISVAAAVAMDAFIGVVASGTALNANPFFETGVANWTPTNCTFTQSSTQEHQGSYSGLMTPNGSSSSVYVQSELEPVTALAAYTASAWMWPTATIAANAASAINWFDGGGGYISSSLVSVNATGGAWNFLSATYNAPANAAQAALVLDLGGTPAATQLVYWDEAKLRPATPTGDAAADLYAQYLAAPAELVQGVRR